MTADLSNMVVEVLHNRGDDDHPDWSIGSGFFVGTSLVLTALHNVDGKGELLVRVRGNEEYPAVVRLQGDKDMDLAVLDVSGVTVDVPPLRYGEVVRRAPAVVEQCWAIGFPHLKVLEHERGKPKPPPSSAHVYGEIPTGENLGQQLLTLQVRNSPRPQSQGSEWEGMSGAVVFSGDYIVVGVITEHHLPEGESALTVVPITALDLLPEAQARKWWKLLGMDRQALVHLPGETPFSLSLSTRPKNYIPFPRDPLFQSRPGEFEQLERLLFEPRREKLPSCLGLVGMGGIGKTQLAIELAYRLQYRFRAGVFWMTATGNNVFDWQLQFSALALNTDYLPPDDNPSSSEKERRRALHLCRYLADHEDALLILDNVEDPILVMTAIPALAGGKVACSVLYTSRITLQPEGVTIYLVEPLSEENALRLLLPETRQPLLAQIEAERLDTEWQSARAICQSVSCLPLALILLRKLLKRDQHLTLARLQQVLTQHGALNLMQALSSTFELSWVQVQGEEAQCLFKLACYFPEAAPIPLWLLGLAAGLGEESDILSPLGQTCMQLKELSLVETRSSNEIHLHPLVREFGLSLIASELEQAAYLSAEALKHLSSSYVDLHALESRAHRVGFWNCLEQMKALHTYTAWLGGQEAEITRVERWLNLESYLLSDERWWPETLPGLFYQQLFNRAVEAGEPFKSLNPPASWLKQVAPVGVEDQALLRTFMGHTRDVKSVAFSPNGQIVLTGSADATARLWETSSGKALAILQGHTRGLCNALFSPDGRFVLTGSADATARLWETSSGKALATFQGHTREVTSIAFSPDGHSVLTGSKDKTSRRWETSSGKVGTLRGLTEWVTNIAFSPDGHLLFIGLGDGNAGLWEWSSGKALASLDAHWGTVTSVAFSPDGHLLLTGGDDTARLWEVHSGKALATFRGHTNRVVSVAFSPDERFVLTGSFDKTAQLWETRKGKAFTALQGHTGAVASMAFSRDGRLLLTGSSDKTARLWEAHSGKALATFRGHTRAVVSVAFSPNGRFVLTGSNDRTARLWKTRSGKAFATLQEERISFVISVAFSPNGRFVLTGSTDGIAKLWDASSGKLLASLQDNTDHFNWVESVAFSPDGRLLFIGKKADETDQIAQLWEISSGKVITTLQGHNGMVKSVAFSRDGLLLLTGELGGTVRLWETSSGKVLATFQGHTSTVSSVAFSPDGKMAVTGDDNGWAFFWRLLGVDKERPLGLYVTTFGVGAIFWQDASHLLLADNGGTCGHPYVYRLSLEGLE